MWKSNLNILWRGERFVWLCRQNDSWRWTSLATCPHHTRTHTHRGTHAAFHKLLSTRIMTLVQLRIPSVCFTLYDRTLKLQPEKYQIQLKIEEIILGIVKTSENQTGGLGRAKLTNWLGNGSFLLPVQFMPTRITSTSCWSVLIQQGHSFALVY